MVLKKGNISIFETPKFFCDELIHLSFRKVKAASSGSLNCFYTILLGLKTSSGAKLNAHRTFEFDALG